MTCWGDCALQQLEGAAAGDDDRRVACAFFGAERTAHRQAVFDRAAAVMGAPARWSPAQRTVQPSSRDRTASASGSLSG